MKGELHLVSLSLSQEEKFRPGTGSISHLTTVAILAPLASSEILLSGQCQHGWEQKRAHTRGVTWTWV